MLQMSVVNQNIKTHFSIEAGIQHSVEFGRTTVNSGCELYFTKAACRLTGISKKAMAFMSFYQLPSVRFYQICLKEKNAC